MEGSVEITWDTTQEDRPMSASPLATGGERGELRCNDRGAVWVGWTREEEVGRRGWKWATLHYDGVRGVVVQGSDV